MAFSVFDDPLGVRYDGSMRIRAYFSFEDMTQASAAIEDWRAFDDEPGADEFYDRLAAWLDAQPSPAVEIRVIHGVSAEHLARKAATAAGIGEDVAPLRLVDGVLAAYDEQASYEVVIDAFSPDEPFGIDSSQLVFTIDSR